MRGGCWCWASPHTTVFTCSNNDHIGLLLLMIIILAVALVIIIIRSRQRRPIVVVRVRFPCDVELLALCYWFRKPRSTSMNFKIMKKCKCHYCNNDEELDI